MDEQLQAELREKLGDKADVVLSAYTGAIKTANELSEEKSELLNKRDELLVEVKKYQGKAKELEEERNKLHGNTSNIEDQFRGALEEQAKLRKELERFQSETRNSSVREKILTQIGDKVVSGSTPDVVSGVFSSLKFGDDGQPYMAVGDRKLTNPSEWIEKYLEIKPWFKASKQAAGAGSSGSNGGSASEIEQMKKRYREALGSSSMNSKAEALTIKRKLAQMGETV